MKAKLFSVVAIVVIGIIVLSMTVSNYAAIENEYNANLASARANADNLLPYNAYIYYKAAFEIRCNDEAVYQEFLTQAEALGVSYYKAAIKDYVVKFPTSTTAHEMLCKMYYDEGSYRQVLTAALDARDKGAASTQVRDWYNECAYMLDTIKEGIAEPQSFVGSYALVKVNDKYGYINQNGDYLIAPVYAQASALTSSSFAVHDGEEWCIVNMAGFKVARTSVPVDYMGILVSGKIPVAKDGKYAYVTRSLQIPETLPYDYASNFKNGVAAVKKGDKWAIVDTDEKNITDFIFDDVVLDEYNTCGNQGALFVKKDGKYYLINTRGQRLLDQGFDAAEPFTEAGPAAVCLSGKWGFLDATGQMVIEPQYEGAKSFNIGMGAVCENGRWGYINTNGEIRVQCQFEDCKPFAANGIAAVKENGIWKYVRLLLYCV